MSGMAFKFLSRALTSAVTRGLLVAVAVALAARSGYA
jgi:hypothetical protein